MAARLVVAAAVGASARRLRHDTGKPVIGGATIGAGGEEIAGALTRPSQVNLGKLVRR